MRHILLSTAGWAAVLQAVNPPAGGPVDSAARLIGIASVLGTLTVLVYRLGVWRQEVENTKQLAATRATAGDELVERRLEAIEHVLVEVHGRLQRLERGLTRVERRLERVEAAEVAA